MHRMESRSDKHADSPSEMDLRVHETILVKMALAETNYRAESYLFIYNMIVLIN